MHAVIATPAAATIRGYTISVRTLRGRLLVHIDKAALMKLGASADEKSLLQTLNRHMPRFHALALQLAARELRSEVSVGADNVWWTAADAAQPASQQVQVL